MTFTYIVKNTTSAAQMVGVIFPPSEKNKKHPPTHTHTAPLCVLDLDMIYEALYWLITEKEREREKPFSFCGLRPKTPADIHKALKM